MTFASDTFSGTTGIALAAPWSKGSGMTGDAIVTAGHRVRATTSQECGYIHTGTPAGADYDVSADYYAADSTAGGYYCLVCARRASGSDTYYSFGTLGNNAWTLYARKGGVGTQVSYATVPFTPVAGTTYRLKLSVRTVGSVVVLRGYVDGAMVIQYIDSSSPITAANFAGFEIYPVGNVSNDSTGAQLDNFQADDYVAPTSPVTVNADDAAIKYGGFYVSGTGGSSYAHTNSTQSRIDVTFSGSTFVILNFDASLYAGLAADSCPTVKWRIDGGAWSSTTLNAAISDCRSEGLTTGTHTLEVVYSSRGNASSGELWIPSTTPLVAVRFTGLTLGTGATVSAPTLYSRRGITYGDSIWENEYEITYPPVRGDATKGIAYQLRALLNSEVDSAGYSGQGWTGALTLTSDTTTTFLNTWDKYDSTHSRLSGGVFTVHYDWVYVEHGYNWGTPTDAQFTAWMTAMRTALGSSTTPIFINAGSYDAGHNVTGITNMVNTYLAANPSETHLFLINLGTLSPYTTTDGIHPDIAEDARIAPLLAAAISPHLATAPHFRRRAGGSSRSGSRQAIYG